MRQESRVRMRGVRAAMEQEEPGVTPVKGGGGGKEGPGLRFARNHSCALQ